MSCSGSRKWIVGVTGASGVRYAVRFISLLSGISETHVIFSQAALRVLAEEEGVRTSFSGLKKDLFSNGTGRNLHLYNVKDIGALPASGSFCCDGMVIVPCSMGTLGIIANGSGFNLIHRAADVVLKEKRRLILVPRETPLSEIHLENMLKLSRLGVAMVPAMPGFYHRPAQISDLVDMMCMKVLDSMGIENDLVPRWKDPGGIEVDSEYERNLNRMDC